MITTYGFSIAANRFTKDMRLATIDAVFRWLNDVHPHEQRTNTTRVSIRHGDNDPIFRVDVLEQDAHQAAARGTTATLIVSKKELYFDLRRTLKPTRSAVLPRRTIDRPEPRLNDLVLDIAKIFNVRDAEQSISESIITASEILDGQSLAAFAEAPGRRLPIVIETTTSKGAPITSRTTARQLAGIAHVAHVTSRAAEDAFNSMYGKRLIGSSWVTVLWPRGADPENFHQQDDEQLVAQLIAASIGSLPTLILAPPPKNTRPQKDDVPTLKPYRSPSIASAELSDTSVLAAGIQRERDELLRKNRELSDERETLMEENTALAETLELTDLLSAQKAEERDRALSQLTTFLLMDEDKTYLERASEAVEYAHKNLPHLVVHQRAIDSASESHLMNGRRIYANLVELNNLAARLQRGDIAPNVFNIYCTQQLTNFVPSISDEAVHRYAQDYAINWKGENVLAKPHIRCGDARVHFYHDKTTNEIVVAYVGRHLRDKTTN